MHSLAKILIFLGIMLLLVGLSLLFPGKLPISLLGKLPGDVFYHKNNITIFAPFTSMIILSVVLTIVLNLLIRWFK